MKTDYIITTSRLGLRNWKLNDQEPFAKMCQNKEVMKYFPNTLSKNESNDLIHRMQKHFINYGFCYFAIDLLKTNEFIGFTGLLHQNFKSIHTPCVDIGWRLKQSAWKKGYATEAAKACLHFGFSQLNVHEIFAFASSLNKESENIMKKIGMKHVGNFNHEKLTNTNLNPCLAYKITK